MHAATSSTINVFNLLLAIVFNIYYSDGTVKLWRVKSRLDSMAWRTIVCIVTILQYIGILVLILIVLIGDLISSVHALFCYKPRSKHNIYSLWYLFILRISFYRMSISSVFLSNWFQRCIFYIKHNVYLRVGYYCFFFFLHFTHLIFFLTK